MKDLKNYGVQELDAMEVKKINGGDVPYADWASYPTDGNGNPIITPGTGLGVAIENAGVAIYNAGVWVYNGVSSWFD